MKYLLPFVIQFIFIYAISGQEINTILTAFNQDSLIKTVRELSGEDSAMINSTKTIIKNRAAYLGGNLTEDYLKARLSGYNLEVQTQKYSINGLNIFGIQKGTRYPGEAYYVGAHQDAITYYCADDNASGCAAVMETARILSRKSFEYTIIYTFWDEEEVGLWGSTYHAKQLKANGLTFKGLINLDMIGYDGNNDRKFDIHVYPDPTSLRLADSALAIISRNKLNLEPQIVNPGTDQGDHYAYWKQGMVNAICIGEQMFSGDPNPAYHTVNDRIGIFNLPYFTEISKMTVGLMATLAKPILSGINDFPDLTMVKIYPNPTKGLLTIEMKTNQHAKVIVSDIAGRILLEKDFLPPVNTIHLSNLPNGMYLLTLLQENEIFTRKICKTQ